MSLDKTSLYLSKMEIVDKLLDNYEQILQNAGVSY